MNRWVKLYSSYSFLEFLEVLLALAVDSIFKRIPKQLFIVKNTYDRIIIGNGDFIRRDNEVYVSINGLRIVLRLKGSDFLVFNQIVLNDGMNRVIQIMRELKIDAPKILDCGANIGLCTLVLKNTFPNAEVIAIEPAKGNFDQLKKNVSLNGYNNVRLSNSGVWYESTLLALTSEFGDKSDWAFALEKSEDEELNNISVDSPEQIALAHGWDRIDFLKIDIEGSEFSMFANLHRWQNIFDTIKVVSIEIHEEIGDIELIMKVLRENGFTIERHHELTIGVKR